VRFSSGATRENGILESVHNDVFGPVIVSSFGGSLYYVSFIDYFSRKTWIYFLRNKSEVFERFKEFKDLVENQTKKRIKVMRNDNGGEFRGNKFDQFCKKCGIAHQNTTPYTPQKNGVAERMNKMLMDKERSMLNRGGIVPEFWVEADATTRYLMNMSSWSALINTTPNEVWSGKNPLVAHLKYLAMMHLCMFPRKRGERWKRSQSNVFSLDIKKE
jgi:transposase InsO family protein